MVRSMAVLGTGASLMISLSLHGCGNGNSPTPPPTTCETPSPYPANTEPLPVPTDPLHILSWASAEALAKEMVAGLGLCDKVLLMQGVGWMETNHTYVGNTRGNPTHKIPSLNMQDAAGGFRNQAPELVGTTTAWPSLLAVAATWNPSTVRTFTMALGAEFVGKGANTILGPSVNLHRVARGGRNFEYLSGEDPFLGAALTDAYVRGVQSQGVMAVMKHWVFNNQETNRNNYSSIVDEQTKWELYYPPFIAAVNAGTSATMCSYNLEGGIYSCENTDELRTLKNTIGFRGFVQSDWFATHSTSVQAGLDQNMPGLPWEHFFDPVNLANVDGSSNGQTPFLDEAVTRILAAMYRLDIFNRTRCAPPNCDNLLAANVSTPEHKQLARVISAESIVLLKNSDNTLPIDATSIQTLAIVGSPADAQPLPFNDTSNLNWMVGDYYSGGGSGHIATVDIVSPLSAIRARAEALGITVLSDVSGSTTTAADLAAQADLTLVFGATTSGESIDRVNLTLDNDADGLVTAVVAACNSTNPRKKAAVLVMIPGAVTMPWHSDPSVSSIAVQFLGGEGAGSAWADVLFGDVAPAGRLPVMIPETEADTIPPVNSSTMPYDVVYSEGMGVSYRNTDFKAAFAFGHGLTYSTFEYNFVTVSPCRAGERRAYCASVEVTNSGLVAARAVPQLYLQFPAELNIIQGQNGLLKGFQKTGLINPGEAVAATFVLTTDEFSYYSVDAGDWVQATEATAHVGGASDDIRVTHIFTQEEMAEAFGAPRAVTVIV